MEKNKKTLWRFKEYFLVPLFLCVIMAITQFGTYYLGSFINGFYKTMWSVDFKLPVDDKIPFLVDFTTIYLLGNVYNILILFLINFFIGRKAMYMLVTLEIVGFLLSLICFICIPSPITSLVTPKPDPGTGFSGWLYTTLIVPDTTNNASNFPSQHFIYLISVVLTCFSFVKLGFKKDNIKVISMCILSSIVFVIVGLSTFFIKQHFVSDAIASVILMTVLYVIFHFAKIFPKINLFFKTIYLKMHLPGEHYE